MRTSLRERFTISSGPWMLRSGGIRLKFVHGNLTPRIADRIEADFFLTPFEPIIM